MITDQTNPGEFQEKKKVDHSDIPGWGIDADPKNDPVYPMKKRTNEDQEGYKWERPPLQPETVEVLRSVERPNMTAVFGTSTPPSGLSGIIRRWAYKYSESSFGRWLPLFMADRVDVVEGIVSDISKGRMPGLISERGWKSEWEYNRTSLITKMAIGAAVTGFLVSYFISRKKASHI
jgi:hypothetical protein